MKGGWRGPQREDPAPLTRPEPPHAALLSPVMRARRGTAQRRVFFLKSISLGESATSGVRKGVGC